MGLSTHYKMQELTKALQKSTKAHLERELTKTMQKKAEEIIPDLVAHAMQTFDIEMVERTPGSFECRFIIDMNKLNEL